MDENTIFSLDFETLGLCPYFPEFEIKSLAVAYSSSSTDKINTKFFTGLEEIEGVLTWLSDNQAKCICFNIGFEQLVMKCKYPELHIPWHSDVMRLSQLRGLPEDDKSKDRETGFSLKANTRRFLPHMADYEQEAYTWIRENLVVPRGKEGSYLSQLPYDILRRYNEADAIAALQLYWYFTSFFDDEGYDWTIDHELYMTLADFVIESEIRGIKVNRKQLQDYKEAIKQEVAEIDGRFVAKFGTEIEEIREQLRQKQQAKFKKKVVTELPAFNITSKKHLEMLFCDKLGMEATYKTPKGGPSFKSDFLFQYGAGGKMLSKRGKRLLVSSQVNNLDVMVERDGQFHPKLRIVGTRTGRLAGASQKKSYGVSLNLQAIARRDEMLMSSLLAQEGNIMVSQDLCFTAATEILTNVGWIKATEIRDEHLVWQVDRNTLQGSFIKPIRIIKREYTGNLITYKSKRGPLTVTEGHRMLFVGQQNHPTRKDKALYRKDIKAGEEHEITSGCHFGCFSNNSTTSNWDIDDIDRVCALHADGHLNYIRKDGIAKYSIEVSRPRKVKECTRLFGEPDYNCPPNAKQNLHRFSWYVSFNHPLLTEKSLNLELLGANQADIFVECLKKWDGSAANDSSRTGRIHWSTVKKEEAEKVQIYLVTSGYECRIQTTYRDESRCTIYTLSIRKRGCIRFKRSDRTSITPSGRLYNGSQIVREHVDNLTVGCVEVPSGYIQVRQGGQTFISGNCRGEPTVISFYTKDKNYRLVNCEMTGRKPYFDGDLLISDDQYITLGSIIPFARPKILELIDNSGGLDKFGDLWLSDPDSLKAPIKDLRKVLKTSALALGYSAQAKRIYSRCNEVQCPITMKEAEALYEAFWALYPAVKRYADHCTTQMRRKGYIYNALGYRCVTEPRKAFNMLAQSSINGVMSLFIQELNKLYEKSLPITILHDEVIVEIPEEDLEVYKKCCEQACINLNDVLGWDIPIRTGFAYGRELYSAK